MGNDIETGGGFRWKMTWVIQCRFRQNPRGEHAGSPLRAVIQWFYPGQVEATQKQGRIAYHFVFCPNRKIFFPGNKRYITFVAKNREREIRGLTEAMDFFKTDNGVIITFNQHDVFMYGGKRIEVLPACEFLTAK